MGIPFEKKKVFRFCNSLNKLLPFIIVSEKENSFFNEISNSLIIFEFPSRKIQVNTVVLSSKLNSQTLGRRMFVV